MHLDILQLVCIEGVMWFDRWAAVPDEDWPQQKAQRDVMLADFDFQNGYGDRYGC